MQSPTSRGWSCNNRKPGQSLPQTDSIGRKKEKTHFLLSSENRQEQQKRPHSRCAFKPSSQTASLLYQAFILNQYSCLLLWPVLIDHSCTCRLLTCKTQFTNDDIGGAKSTVLCSPLCKGQRASARKINPTLLPLESCSPKPDGDILQPEV